MHSFLTCFLTWFLFSKFKKNFVLFSPCSCHLARARIITPNFSRTTLKWVVLWSFGLFSSLLFALLKVKFLFHPFFCLSFRVLNSMSSYVIFNPIPYHSIICKFSVLPVSKVESSWLYLLQTLHHLTVSSSFSTEFPGPFNSFSNFPSSKEFAS